MAEAEQVHRIESERLVLETNVRATQAEIEAARRGSWMGFAVSLIAILGALAAVYLGAHWSVPVAFVSVPVMTVVRALVLRK